VNINGSPFLVGGPLKITQSPEATVPEASTWAMMPLGFAGLALAGFRRHATLTRQRRAPHLARAARHQQAARPARPRRKLQRRHPAAGRGGPAQRGLMDGA
jgi:hypothetical protein